MRRYESRVAYDPILLTPGPTNIHPDVLDYMAKAQLAHNSPEFIDTFKELTNLIRELLDQDNGELAVITGSGTLGLEAVFSSLTNTDDNVLVLSTGFFGDQLAKLARYYTKNVDVVEFRLGEPADPDVMKELLSKKEYQLVCMTHVDTSTGVLNPIRRLVGLASSSGALTLVDAVSSVGGVEFSFESLGADIVVTSSQKCIAAPPGVVIVALSDAAYNKLVSKGRRARSYYLDLAGWVEATKRPGDYKATPAVHVYAALKRAVELVLEEGLEKRWARHEEQARYFRSRMSALGFDVVSLSPSPTVSVFDVSKLGVSTAKVRQLLYEGYRICVSTGMPPHTNEFLRIGHMGNITTHHLDMFLEAFAKLFMDEQKG